MFDNLSERLNSVFKKLKGEGKLSEKNIEDGMREVRMALLEADAHYKVVKKLIADIKERAIGQEVLTSLTPGQQVIKIVNDELTALMGSQHEDLNLSGPSPAAVMLVGLQGSGKTTSAGKLAVHLRKTGKKPYMVPVDVYRPAAIDQLTKLAGELSVPVYPSTTDMDPVGISRKAREAAREEGCDVMILDTAGRLHIDETLMAELANIKKTLEPSDIMLVADAMTGQDAVNIAQSFNEDLDIDGVILSKMDGDARGGAALSIKAITGKPIKFIGVGEKSNALEPFHPDRMAQRIQAFPSGEFYDGQLRPATGEVAGQRIGDLAGVSPGDLPAHLRDSVAFVDPGGSQQGNTNPTEARAVVETVGAFRQAGVPAADIGVIAPFRAQVAEITSRVPPGITVDTVDRFQGSSKEVIVVSFVATGALDGPIFEDYRRINVALTRAKKSLVLVGDAEALSTDDTYARMVEWAR